MRRGPAAEEGGLRVLLTGATGLIGRAVLAGLTGEGHAVVAVARSAGAAARLPEAAAASRSTSPRRPALPTGCRISPASMRWSTAPACCRTARATPPPACMPTAPAALFAACEQAGVRRVVQISAIGVDRGAATAFARTKLAGDEALMARDLDWVILRPSVVVGRQAYGGSALFRGLAALPHPAARWRTPDRCRSCSSTTWCARSCSSCEPGAPSRVVARDCRAGAPVARGGARRLSPLARAAATPRFVTRAALAGSRRVSAGRSHRPARLAAAAALHRAARARCAAPSAIPAPWTRLTGIEPRALGAALAAEPASVQERWFARLYFAKPLMLGGAGALLDRDRPGGARARAGRTPWASSRTPASLAAAPLAAAGAIADIAIGVAIAIRRTARPALWAALALSIAYAGARHAAAAGAVGRPAGPLAEGRCPSSCSTWWRWRSWTTADDAYLALKYLHVIGAAVLLGTGAGIAFFMLLAHRTGEARTVAAVARIVVIADFLFTATAVVAQPITGVLLAWASRALAARGLDRAVDPALSRHRRLLAAGGVDADAHARPRRRGRARGRSRCRPTTTACSASGSPSASPPSPPCSPSSG